MASSAALMAHRVTCFLNWVECAGQELRSDSETRPLCQTGSWLGTMRPASAPDKDQTIQMSFCPNSAPSAVVVFDARTLPSIQKRGHTMTNSGQTQGLYSSTHNSLDCMPAQRLRSGGPASDLAARAAAQHVPTSWGLGPSTGSNDM